MRTFFDGMLCVVLLVVPVAAWAQRDSGDSASNGVLRVGTERIKRLEDKANDRDLLAFKIRQLEAELAQARAEESRSKTTAVGGRLQDMERKVKNYDALLDLLEKKNKDLTELEQNLQLSIQQVNSMKDEIAAFHDCQVSLSNTVTTLQVTEKSLRATIEQLLLGNFEYYEVKSGDTIESIAKKPMIYDDASRTEWLRQANTGRVKDLDHLREGEMVVIPRFPLNGVFAF